MSDTREKILMTALRLFARDGYEAVSVSTIAGELGMTKGALYKHYKNKRDIFDSIVERMYQIDAQRAEEYEVPPDVNRCYFFNPFSVEILHKVMARIIESYYENPRELFLFFYYPSDEYISYLMTVDELEFYDEIECDDLFEGHDMRERIMIFQLPDYE